MSHSNVTTEEIRTKDLKDVSTLFPIRSSFGWLFQSIGRSKYTQPYRATRLDPVAPVSAFLSLSALHAYGVTCENFCRDGEDTNPSVVTVFLACSCAWTATMFEFQDEASQHEKCYATIGQLPRFVDPKQPPTKKSPFSAILSHPYVHTVC